MTLREFFNLLDDPANATLVLSIFAIMPLAAFLLGLLARKEGHLSPWKYIYSAIIYIVSIPGIFAITLNIYLFLFENQSILDTNLYTQVVPIISMIITLIIVNKNVELGWIPGFNRLPGLLMVIASAFAVMWFVDRTRIWMVSFLRFEYVLLIFILLLVVIRFGWNRIMGPTA